MDETHVYFSKHWQRFVSVLRSLLQRSATRPLSEDGGNLKMEDKPTLELSQSSGYTDGVSTHNQMEFIVESLEANDYRVACT
jgi:hypothetical protein